MNTGAYAQMWCHHYTFLQESAKIAKKIAKEGQVESRNRLLEAIIEICINLHEKQLKVERINNG